VRENKKKGRGSSTALRMIQTYKNRISKDDQKYIKVQKDNWLENLNSHPISMSSGRLGRSGIIVEIYESPKITKKIIATVVQSTKKIAYSFLHYAQIVSEFKIIKKQVGKRFGTSWFDIEFHADDKTGLTPIDRHYFYHPAWAARLISKTSPKLHVDISSITSFSTIVSAFVPVKFYDFRLLRAGLSNFYSDKANLENLPFKENSIKSVSCMHTVEHIGLGRYGDKLNSNGDLAAFNELQRVLARGGNLFFVTPVGKPRLVFNAHRVYSYREVIKNFSGLSLKEFTLIPEHSKNPGLVYNATEKMADSQHYGCGCFWFTKERQ
jgi:hypothetical protein